MNKTLSNFRVKHNLDRNARLRQNLSQNLRILTKSKCCTYRDFLIAAKKARCVFESPMKLMEIKNYFSANNNTVNIQNLVAMLVTVEDQLAIIQGKYNQLNRVIFQAPNEFAITIPEVTCEDEEEHLKQVKSHQPIERLNFNTTRSTRINARNQAMDKTTYTSRSRFVGCLEAEGPINLIHKLKANFEEFLKQFVNLDKQSIDLDEFDKLIMSILPYYKDRQDIKFIFNLISDQNVNRLSQQGLNRIQQDTQKLCFLAQTLAQMKSRHLIQSQMKIRPSSIGQMLVLKAKKPSVLNIGSSQSQDYQYEDLSRPTTTSLTVKVKPRLRHYRRRSQQKNINPSENTLTLNQEDLIKNINKRVSSRLHPSEALNKQLPRLTLSSRLRSIFNNKIMRNLANQDTVQFKKINLSPAHSKLTIIRDYPF